MCVFGQLGLITKAQREQIGNNQANVTAHDTRLTAIEGDTAKWNTLLQDSLGQVADYYIVQSGDSVWAYPNVHTSLTAYRDTNLTDVLEDCMSELTSGGLIQIGKGVYDHMSMVEIPYDQITIQGAGKHLTTLKIKANNDVGAAQGHLFYIAGKDSITIQDLAMDGNLLNQSKIDSQTGTQISSSCGVRAFDTVAYNYSYNLAIKDCYIHDFASNGVVVWGGIDPIVENCLFEDNGVAAIQYFGFCERGIIRNNTIKRSAFGTNFSHGTIIEGNHVSNPRYLYSWASLGNCDVLTIEDGADTEPPNDMIIRNNTIEGDSISNGIRVIGGSTDIRIEGNTIRGTVMDNASGIRLEDDTTSVVTGNHVYDWANTGDIGIWCDDSEDGVYSNNILETNYAGIYFQAASLRNKATGNDIKSNNSILVQSGSTNNVLLFNNINGYGGIVDSDGDNISIGNYNHNGNWETMMPDVYKRNWAYTADADGEAVDPGSQNITVTSDGANNILFLPTASATTIGTVITGKVGANGFELRVASAQAGTVYLNGVTTNVEAAIPANTNFRVELIDATHWILTATTNLGAVVTAIVPDAI